MSIAEMNERDRLQKTLLPCAHCNSGGVLKKRGNSISYWVVKCTVCRAEVGGGNAEVATDNWNRRPYRTLVKLPAQSFILPAGQKWSYVMVHEDNTVTFMDWQDGNLVGQIDINLGDFFLSRLMLREDG